jgi:transcription elongation GreA/GreB family factor
MLAAMPLREFAETDGIAISAVVTTSSKGASTTHFLVPAAGGVKLELAGERVQTLATDSPLGQALLGLSAGDTAEVKTPRGMLAYDVVSVR